MELPGRVDEACAVEFRGVRLAPPEPAELDWIMGALHRPEISSALGWDDGVGAEVYAGYIEEKVLLLPFRRPRDGSGPVHGLEPAPPTGFIMLVRPSTDDRRWSVNVAVPEPRRRDGFTVLAALDALCHLVFDVRRDAGLDWLIEPTNLASRVLPKRLGYRKIDDVERNGTPYERYGIDASDWTSRCRRLAARGSVPRFDVIPVDPARVAHGRIIRAIRGRARS